MYERFFTPPEESFFLFGPRGTGKSTWLKHYFTSALWIDLLDPETFRIYLAAPEKLVSLLKAHPHQKVVIIDEVQKVPEILNVVHSLIERQEGYQFIMTGSSVRKLKKQGVNLLGGRALLRHMFPFFSKEIQDQFQLSQNLKMGMLPIALSAANPEDILRAYVGIYLKEEVQAEGIVRNVGDFARFLEVMSFSHGSLINGANIARECQIARKTVDSYLLILEDLLLSFQLHVFRRKAKRALVTHSKFYFFDAGVYCSLRPHFLYDVQSKKEGAALEGLVGQHLRGWVTMQKQMHQLHFWQTQSKIEVDFIVSGPETFLAMEVKNAAVIHPQDYKGLLAFSQDYPQAQLVLLYRGKKRYKEKNILCLPAEDFLMGIDPRKPIEEALA